jgi:hypothetical protein
MNSHFVSCAQVCPVYGSAWLKIAQAKSQFRERTMNRAYIDYQPSNVHRQSIPV